MSKTFYVPSTFEPSIENLESCCGLSLVHHVTDIDIDVGCYYDLSRGEELDIYTLEDSLYTDASDLRKLFKENKDYFEEFEDEYEEQYVRIKKSCTISVNFLSCLTSAVDKNWHWMTGRSVPTGIHTSSEMRHTYQMNIIDQQIKELGGLKAIQAAGWKRVHRFQNAGKNANWINVFLMYRDAKKESTK